MRIIDNNRLCIEFKEMVEARALETGNSKESSERYLWKANSVGTKGYGFTKDPADLRCVLLIWDEMNHKNQRMIKNWLRKRTGCKHDDHAHCDCGSPYKYMLKDPIRQTLIGDAKAEAFFLQYRYEGPTGDDKLPFETIKKYSLIAGIYNAVLAAESDKKKNIKERFGIDVGAYYDTLFELIGELKNADLLPAKFPATYQNFRSGMLAYKDQGYASIIHPSFGNKCAAKIGKTENGYDPQVEAQIEALIRKAASKHNNFDAEQIKRNLNLVLKAKGWPEISVETVRLRMKKYEHLTTAGRRGKRAHNNVIAMHVEREAPQYPLLYWTLDGWTVELLFQDEHGYDNRLVVVVVLDACGKYPVGYAIGDRENSELIKQANRNAILHVQQLFGEAYRPNQLQSDHYALKTLTPFYAAVAHLHTPAAVGNAKSKIVEPYFKYLNKNYCQIEENFSGFNIDASKDNQPNKEYLDKIKKSFPTKEGVINQIIRIIEKERRLKLPQYMQAFNAMPEEAKHIITKEQFLMVFGRATKDTIKIHAAGLQPQINNIIYSYTSFDPAFASHREINWRVMYDENDMSEALAVSEDGRLSFLLERKMRVAMDLYSSTPEDHTYRSRIAQYNKERREEIVQQYAVDADLVDEVLNAPLQIDADQEATLKLMFTHAGQQKERIQDAKKLANAARKQLAYAQKEERQEQDDWQTQQLQYLASKTQFNSYLD